MLKTKVVKGVLGVSAVAALFAALAVQAQSGAATATGSTGTGQSTTGQTGSQSSMGQAGQSGAQGDSQAGAQSGTQAGSSTASGAGTMGAATLSRSDQKMVKDMAMANLAEIETGRMAQTKSQNEQVKNFAQQMIDDHTKALEEVRQLAQTKGVTLPSTLDRAHKAKADKLAALSGDAFDRAYMAQAGVADHKKTHGMLTKAQGRAKDPDIKALVTRMTPTVDQHLNAAKELHGNQSKATGSSGTSTEKSGQ